MFVSWPSSESSSQLLGVQGMCKLAVLRILVCSAARSALWCLAAAVFALHMLLVAWPPRAWLCFTLSCVSCSGMAF